MDIKYYVIIANIMHIIPKCIGVLVCYVTYVSGRSCNGQNCGLKAITQE